MSGEDGHTFTSADLMKAFRGYAIREQEDGHAVGFIRNGCYGMRKASHQLVAGGVPQKTFCEVCFGSRLRSDTLKGETTRGESRTTNRRAAPAPPRKIFYYKTRPQFAETHLLAWVESIRCLLLTPNV